MTPVSIRPYRHPHDYPAVRALWESMEKGVNVGRSDSPDEIAKKAARDPDLFLLAEADGLIVGSIIAASTGGAGCSITWRCGVNSAGRASPPN